MTNVEINAESENYIILLKFPTMMGTMLFWL
jgi:hypothetical protein